MRYISHKKCQNSAEFLITRNKGDVAGTTWEMNKKNGFIISRHLTRRDLKASLAHLRTRNNLPVSRT